MARLVFTSSGFSSKEMERHQFSGRKSNNVPKDKSCFYHAEERKSRARVYCKNGDHVSSTCTRATTLEERKKFLAQKGMCFNCTGTKPAQYPATTITT